jgi:flagellin
MRINSASDDAAGLAISESLRASSRVFTTGIRNFNDGVSLLSIAEGAIGELSSIVSRLKELAEQSSNGTYTNKQRNALDAEAQSLSDEYSRIIRTTSFNGSNLFDGTISELRFQGGFGVDGGITSSMGGDIGTGRFTSSSSTTLSLGTYSDIIATDLNNDGNRDVIVSGTGGGSNNIRIQFLNGDGSIQSSTTFSALTNGLEIADVNNDGYGDIITGGSAASGQAAILVHLNNGDGTFRSGMTMATTAASAYYDMQAKDINGDGKLDIAVSGSMGTGETHILLGNGDGTFSLAQTYQAGVSATLLFTTELEDLNGDGNLDLFVAGSTGADARFSVRLGNGDGTFRLQSTFQPSVVALINNVSTTNLADINGDGALDYYTAGRNTTGGLHIGFGNGDGTFRASRTYSTATPGLNTVSHGDFNSDGKIDIIGTGTNASFTSVALTTFLSNGDGTFSSVSTDLGIIGTALAGFVTDINNDGVDDYVSGPSPSNLRYFYGETRDGVSELRNFSLKTQYDSKQALSEFDKTLTRLLTQRGEIGAFQSRLTTATNVLSATNENYIAADSRIRDADIASEAANVLSLTILQQAGAALMAQSNRGGDIALKLLRI